MMLTFIARQGFLCHGMTLTFIARHDFYPRGPSGWAHAGPKWVGPRGAQVGGPKLGPSGAQARILGPKKWEKIKIIKVKIRSAQNVDKAFFKPEKNVPGPIWGPPGQFFAWAEKIPKNQFFCTGELSIR